MPQPKWKKESATFTAYYHLIDAQNLHRMQAIYYVFSLSGLGFSGFALVMIVANAEYQCAVCVCARAIA